MARANKSRGEESLWFDQNVMANTANDVDFHLSKCKATPQGILGKKTAKYAAANCIQRFEEQIAILSYYRREHYSIRTSCAQCSHD